MPQRPEGQTPQYKHPAANTWQPREANTPTDKWQVQAEKFANWAHEKLLNNEAQIKYLADRGIAKESAIKYRLGCNPDDYFREKKAWGVADNGKKLWLPRGIVIPYCQNNTLKRLRIRKEEGEPRYYVVPGSGMDTLIINSDAKAFVIVESELDAILIAQELGSITGVVGLGNAQSHPTKFAASRLKKSLHILNALDHDDAGKTASRWWKNNYPQTERWPVPQGKDPGDYFKAGGNIREWLIAGLPPGLRPQPVPENELNKLYQEAFMRLQWAPTKTEDKINKVWLACRESKATIEDFKKVITDMEDVM